METIDAMALLVGAKVKFLDNKEMQEALNMAIDALEKQIPMKAYYEYDDEFICPACNYEQDGYDVKMIKVCPECGQKLCWD